MHGMRGPLRVVNIDEAETVLMLNSDDKEEDRETNRHGRSCTLQHPQFGIDREETRVQPGHPSFERSFTNLLTRQADAEERVFRV